MKTKEEVYRNLNSETIWIRGRGKFEEGRTFLYRPVNGVARPWTDGSGPAAAAIRQEFAALLGLTAAPLTVMPNGQPLAEVVRQILAAQPAISRMVFEGYAFDARAEGSEHNEELADFFRDDLQIVLSDPAAADRWNDKRFFRNKVAAFYGAAAVPAGQEWENPSVGELIQFAEERFQAGVTKVIFKTSGTAGFANLIVEDRQADLSARISNFLSEPFDKAQTWVLAEEWRPWQLSPCISFYYSDGSTEPIWMEMCEQVIDGTTRGFMGGRSFFGLAGEDQQALVEIVRPIAARVYDDGVRGFTGFDVILCPRRPDDCLILPVSGLAVVFIEVNARLNGHNQERLFCSLLAQREGLLSNELAHLRLGTRPLAGAKDRAESQRQFADCLQGLARPLTVGSLGPEDIFFLLDVCNGESRSIYDGLLLVGRDNPVVQRGIEAAFERLQSAGMLRI